MSHELNAEALLARCAVDRVFFVRAILGVEPDDWQLETLKDLDDGVTRLSIRSCHGVGKTALCSWIAIHFLLFRRNTKIVVTSPSSSQMNDGLKPEVSLWINRIPLGLGLRELVDIKTDRVVRVDDPANNFISFRTARPEVPEALAGIHAENVLVLVDEASGVPETIYEAASGTLSTDGAIIVLIGNPTRTTGYFHRTHTKLSHLWRTRHVSYRDSKRVSKDFIETIRLTYGEHSPQWRVRVLGEFPTEDDDTVIPRSLSESMLDRDIVVPPDEPPIWGVDPGRGGDATGFISRNSRAILHIDEWHDSDLMRTVGRVADLWQSTQPSRRPRHVCVDSIGLGAGVADRLRELGLPVIDVNVAEVAAMKHQYARLRDELWYSVREWLQSRTVTCPKDLKYADKLVEELCMPVSIELTNGKLQVESKRELRARGLPSPNLADALCLTFAVSGGVVSGRYTATSWSTPISSRLRGVA